MNFLEKLNKKGAIDFVCAAIWTLLVILDIVHFDHTLTRWALIVIHALCAGAWILVGILKRKNF